MTTPSPDRLKKLGLLQTKREELEQNTTRVKSVIATLNEATFLNDPRNPYVIDGKAIRTHANDLFKLLELGLDLQKQIELLEGELGV